MSAEASAKAERSRVRRSLGEGGTLHAFLSVFIPHPSSLILAISLFLSACSTPRVVEVSHRTRLLDIDAADQHLFVPDPASHMRYRPEPLPADAQRQEFLVRWGGAGIDLVKFEYRQVDKPNTVLEQTYTPQGDRATTFAVRGEEFHSGGPVSAWRVSLWTGDELLAERKSALW